jgi:hypothetical protein
MAALKKSVGIKYHHQQQHQHTQKKNRNSKCNVAFTSRLPAQLLPPPPQHQRQQLAASIPHFREKFQPFSL